MLDQKAFGLAMGFAYAAWMAGLAWLAGLLNVGRNAVSFTAEFYPGYSATFSGGLLGGVYGFLTGLSLGWGVARLYNALREAEATGVRQRPGFAEEQVTPPMGGL